MYNRNNIHTIYRLIHKGDKEGFHYSLCVKNFNEDIMDNALAFLSASIFAWNIMSIADVCNCEKIVRLHLENIEFKLRFNKNCTYVDFLNECEARFRVAEFALSMIRCYL